MGTRKKAKRMSLAGLRRLFAKIFLSDPKHPTDIADVYKMKAKTIYEASVKTPVYDPNIGRAPKDRIVPLPFKIPCTWSNEGHDMMSGFPCSCGSWHTLDDWLILYRPSLTAKHCDLMKKAILKKTKKIIGRRKR